jgi:arsenite methyltransferase
MNISCAPVEASAELTSLFDRWHWMYAFFRERLFADHTNVIADLMQARSQDVACPTLFELGCGPGFYSSGLAKRFPQWKIVGLDRSTKLLDRARARIAHLGIANCTFEFCDATRLSAFPDRANFVLASRLLMVLPERAEALCGTFRLLAPGGALLIAEPKKGWRSEVPMRCMKILDRLTFSQSKMCLRECNSALTATELDALLAVQPWSSIRRWSDRRYHYALCEKAPVQLSAYAESSIAGSLATSVCIRDFSRSKNR